MDMTLIYEYILSRIAEDLLPYGYTKNGKGLLFYRYSADRKIACGIEMQKSMFNSPESYSFTFNVGCIDIYELPDYHKERLTLEPLKLALKSPYGGGIRLGHLCRGHDYWWEITDETLSCISIEEFYRKFLQEDILKCARYLDEQTHKKELKYLNENMT